MLISHIIPLSLLTQPSPGTAPWIRSADTTQPCCSCRPRKPGRTGPCCLSTLHYCPSRTLTNRKCTLIFRHKRLGTWRSFTSPTGCSLSLAHEDHIPGVDVNLETLTIFFYFIIHRICIMTEMFMPKADKNENSFNSYQPDAVALQVSPAPCIYANINTNTKFCYYTTNNDIIQM